LLQHLEKHQHHQRDFGTTVATPGSDNRSTIVGRFVVGDHRQPFDAAIDTFEDVHVGTKNPATQKSHASSMAWSNKKSYHRQTKPTTTRASIIVVAKMMVSMATIPATRTKMPLTLMQLAFARVGKGKQSKRVPLLIHFFFEFD
jgi:hypothetical protein